MIGTTLRRWPGELVERNIVLLFPLSALGVLAMEPNEEFGSEDTNGDDPVLAILWRAPR